MSECGITRAHAFFAYKKWCPDELGLLLADFLVAALVAGDAAIRLAVDYFYRATAIGTPWSMRRCSRCTTATSRSTPSP